MGRQPLLNGPTGVAGEIVADQMELALRIGLVNYCEELEVADRIARRSREGHFPSVTHPQGPIDPDLLVAPPVVQQCRNPVARR